MRKSVETPSLARRCLHYFFIFFPVFLYFSFGATDATNYQKGRSLDSSGAASKLAGAAG